MKAGAPRSTTWPLRPATAADARSVADVYLRSRHAAFPLIPRSVHPDDEVREWFADVVLPRGGVWVAGTDDGHVVGMMVLDDDGIDHLYVDPRWANQGLGSAFVALAKRERRNGLQLWTFESNEPARRFYERHGFVAVEATDGSTNEEQAPDVRYAWPGASFEPRP